MKQFRSRSGPFEIQLRFSPEEIDEMCVEALRTAKLLPSSPEPIRIERFIEKHFQCAVRYEEMAAGIMGCTIFDGKGAVQAVVASSRIDDGTKVGERRIRSTIAHEGGHGLMHPSLFMPSLDQGRLKVSESSHENLDFQQRRILCRDTDVREGAGRKTGYDGRWWEWQANRAIGGFLLPATLVRTVVAPFATQSSITRCLALDSTGRAKAEREVADIFEVNPAAARIRLLELYPEQNGQLTF